MSVVDKVNVLKIDKDCFVEREWLDDYVRTIRTICHQHHVQVVSVRMCNSRGKGQHFYVEIVPAIEADLANRLQFLLGDDCGRVDFNRARIDSGLNEWNKLFEKANTRLSTIYTQPNRKSPRSCAIGCALMLQPSVAISNLCQVSTGSLRHRLHSRAISRPLPTTLEVD
jgi:hypothetical protein